MNLVLMIKIFIKIFIFSFLTCLRQFHVLQDQPLIVATKLNPASVSFTIWPPTQHRRHTIINRLIETLSSPSILSKCHGTMPFDEASVVACQIEDKAFAIVGGSSTSRSRSSKFTPRKPVNECLTLSSPKPFSALP
ncbi:hypothetical protein VNO80_02728 [Phaseolus coccineus]|uniref:WPP domain-containing protein n=1 Tax=Phaseolus coccineus TaxID=3886 RepID=A0AAN9NRY8_PHACN